MGKWIELETDASTGKPYLWKCDECGEEVETKYNFCPECGDPKTSKGESINTLVKALETEHKKLREMQVVPPEKCEKCMMEHLDEMEKLEVELEMQKAQPEIIRCKDCKHWIPYDWMFSEVWQSKNIADYPEDEIGCNYCDMTMKANDFCSRAERRTDE